MPGEFVEKLAKHDEPARDSVARKWAEVDRAKIASIPNAATARALLERSPVAYWREVLWVLADFARDTLASRKNLYLWMAL